MLVTVVRGTLGHVVWRQNRTTLKVRQWICSRDGFAVTIASEPAQLEPELAAIIQHSVGLVGAIQQMFQLDL